MHISAGKVELYAAIRRDHRAGLSMRALERKHGVSRRTIRRALDSNWPEPRKKQAPRPTRLAQTESPGRTRGRDLNHAHSP